MFSYSGGARRPVDQPSRSLQTISTRPSARRKSGSKAQAATGARFVPVAAPDDTGAIPGEALPGVGTLLAVKGQRYLVIETWEELDAGEKEAGQLSGGEPFAQAAGLAELARRARQRRLSVVAFTGYELWELRWPAARELLAEVDILVTGRFIRARRDVSLAWRGSRNQEVYF